MKVECTRTLLEAGYATLEEIDMNNETGRQYSLNEITGKPESKVVFLRLVHPLLSDDTNDARLVIKTPEVHVQIKCFPFYSTPRKAEIDNYIDELRTAIRMVSRYRAEHWFGVCSELLYNELQSAFECMPPAENLKTHFTDFKSARDEDGKVITVRACRVLACGANEPIFIFVVFTALTGNPQLNYQEPPSSVKRKPQKKND